MNKDIFECQIETSQVGCQNGWLYNLLLHEILKDPVRGTEWVNGFLVNRLSVDAMASVVNSALYRERSG